MKVAAYQAPLPATGSKKVLGLIREQIAYCEAYSVEVVCCPEGVLGGLADYSASPADIAIDVESGQLQTLLAPLANDRVTTILGFTEIDRSGRLYNSAAVFHRGTVAGIYRKRHPAIRHSVYEPGDELPVFTVGNLTFGITICNDSNHGELARTLTAKGAKALFVPTNNGLPLSKAKPELVAETRKVDIALAIENGVFVIRADVAGSIEGLVSYGSSGIVAPDGKLLQSARQLEAELIVAEIEIASPEIWTGGTAAKSIAAQDKDSRLAMEAPNLRKEGVGPS
ncbi:MAG: carbon-nitrogen hydrolase family protein [Acidobacteria bacterium]|nr:carbon-nitrogen hydrolase family protein [Acidobacteriota bacterium]